MQLLLQRVVVVFVVTFILAMDTVHGHGMLLVPPGRSSRWRYDRTAPKNYDDNGLNCGGFYKQYGANGGKCGICGDDYALPMPRPNELAGKYGQGVVVAKYRSNVITVGVQITANHLGYIQYELCNLDLAGIEHEQCFEGLRFADGSDKFYVGPDVGMVYADIVWPSDIQCEHCILRWTYTAGNNWGMCENGIGAVGCGPQETFKSCADISIGI